MSVLPEQLLRDVELVESVHVVPTILDIVCRSTNMRFAVVSRVTDSHWVACSVQDELEFGLVSGQELALETTFCHSVRQLSKNVIIDHVDQDSLYCNHPIPAQYGFQSYISVPIALGDGSFFGTLCALDPEPRRVNRAETVQMFELFAGLIGKQVDQARAMQITEKNLIDEQEMSALREQFIAVLGHDLRTPLSSLSCGIELLGMAELDADSIETLDIMRRSSVHMAGLIDDVLDFARGRLGSGMSLAYKENVPLQDVVNQVVAELQTMHPKRVIETVLDPHCRLDCDERRLAQLASNLLGNALTHGDPDGVVRLVATSTDGQLQLEVINEGEAISSADQGELFKPFVRSSSGSSAQGLGLGLFIAHCIAEAHGGSIGVKSDKQDTRFTVCLPLPKPSQC
ncbi:GAF domain-containing sensor histidine kinase [Granulosicoccus antarcticus]|uniref:histidine kinase n=1 Tax=Granulosicoccus antarcticus IMCC3135 TaxID=1192854 RepID=A0A2Z2NVP2_9GAMM|nr:GAF domain-containing sensor histidine kinase [Granulosicoccus antarcticus]ASJ75536.1 Bacteriophytochrome [Granulosicoccus antarcticus IMCC3135]